MHQNPAQQSWRRGPPRSNSPGRRAEWAQARLTGVSPPQRQQRRSLAVGVPSHDFGVQAARCSQRQVCHPHRRPLLLLLPRHVAASLKQQPRLRLLLSRDAASPCALSSQSLGPGLRLQRAAWSAPRLRRLPQTQTWSLFVLQNAWACSTAVRSPGTFPAVPCRAQGAPRPRFALRDPAPASTRATPPLPPPPASCTTPLAPCVSPLPAPAPWSPTPPSRARLDPAHASAARSRP
mmetsp:Transcript_19325/g.61491  ORF Transcript_19325/g.61491 Transcript_19325/m.61491 type:complete len:235 (-) Transcript_19325:98-802(-)